MDGILGIALKVFLFCMILTSWRELVRIGVEFIRGISALVIKLISLIPKMFKSGE